MTDHFVSVVLPVYNRGTLIGDAIRSVLAQTWNRFELIVVDDGSTDSTREIVSSFGSAVRLITQSHAGPYRARNHAIENASGDLVAFIDSDDRWYPWRLESQLPLLEDQGVGLVYGDGVLVDIRPGQTRPRLSIFDTQVIPHRGNVVESLVLANFVPMSSVLVRTEVLRHAGTFTESDLSADYLQWIRVARLCEFDYVDRPVFDYSIHGGNISLDLGRSLEARIELFLGEIARETDPVSSRQIAEAVFYLRTLYRIWGIRSGKSERVRAFLATHPDESGATLDKSLLRLARFVAFQTRRRLRRGIAIARSWRGRGFTPPRTRPSSDSRDRSR